MTPSRLLAFLILNFLLAGVGLQYLSVSLYKQHRIPSYCDGTVIHPLHDMASRVQDTDSWYPMLRALDARSSPIGIYQTVFFDREIKFQYPLPSLIPFALLRAGGLSDYKIVDTLKWLSILAFLAQIPCVFVIVSKSFRQPRSLGFRVALAVILVISFYPLSRAYALGQVQIFLDLAFSIAFLSWIDNYEAISGFVIGLSVLVKPQYGLFLLWGLIRKNWKLFTAAFVPLVIGSCAALALYGWENNVAYVNVIRYMGRRGEAFYPNQSINGMLNRWLHNGANITWDVHGFAPHSLVVYAITLLTSAVIVALALWNKAPQTQSGRLAQFGLIAIAATAASPIAWEHHYGILLPIFAWVLPQAMETGKNSRATALLLLSFILCADDLRMTNLLAAWAPWNILQSTVLAGALILFFYLRRIVCNSSWNHILLELSLGERTSDGLVPQTMYQ